MKIAIVDDERPARGELREKILELDPTAQIREAENGSQALKLFKEEMFDLSFLDIRMNDIEGTTLALAVRAMQPETYLVFATAYSEYAVEAFAIGANDYILKPIDSSRLQVILQKSGSHMTRPAAPSAAAGEGKISVYSANRITMINTSDIIFVETEARICKLYTTEGIFEGRRRLSDYEESLSAPNFMKIHKSVIVNIDYISQMFQWSHGNYMVRVRTYPNMLPVSRKKVKELKAVLTGIE